MNPRVLVIFALTIAAIVVLALYTFGPQRQTASRHINPSSLKPRPANQVASQAAVSAYENRDRTENYYGLSIPSDWHVTSGGAPGSYSLTMQAGSGSVLLMDVPDTSTPELFILSQEEPTLKKSLKDYKRIEYKKLKLNGVDAYQLSYRHTQNGANVQTVRTYVTGKDMANVMTFTSPLADFPSREPAFAAVLQSFHWLQ